MFGLDIIRNTRVYQEAYAEGEQQAKLETLPRLLKMGLTVEQVAEAMELDIEAVRQAVPKQS